MMTKIDFCYHIIDTWCEENNIPKEEAHHDIFKSSCLAVALEQLDMLNESEKKYSQQRSGILFSRVILDNEGKFFNTRFITVRDMLELLPSHLDDEESN